MSRANAAHASRDGRGHRSGARLLLVAATAVGLLAAASCSDEASGPVPEARVAAGAATAQVTRHSSQTYADDRYWLCKPDGNTTNHCLVASLDSTVVRADGSTKVVPHKPLGQGSAAVDSSTARLPGSADHCEPRRRAYPLTSFMRSRAGRWGDGAARRAGARHASSTRTAPVSTARISSSRDAQPDLA